MRFDSRTHGGRQLASKLSHLRGQDPLVVALPREGVPVGYEIARELDVLISRKPVSSWYKRTDTSRTARN